MADNKLTISLFGDKYSSAFVKDFNLSSGSSAGENQIVYGASQINGSIKMYDLNGSILKACEKNKNIATQDVSISSKYLPWSKFSGKELIYDMSDRMLGLSLENKYFGSEIDKLQYNGYVCRPYTKNVNARALLEHILQQVFPDTIPYCVAAWDFVNGDITEKSNARNLNFLEIDGKTNTIKCFRPSNLMYGVKIKDGLSSDSFFVFYQNKSVTPSGYSFSKLRFVTRKETQDGKIDVSENGLIEAVNINSSGTARFTNSVGAKYFCIEANTDFNYDINNANGCTLEIQILDVTKALNLSFSSLGKRDSLGFINLPRLKPMSVRSALSKVGMLGQYTIKEDGTKSLTLCPARTSSEKNTIPDNIVTYPKKWMRTDVEYNPICTNNYDSIDMEYDVAKELVESANENIEIRGQDTPDLSIEYYYAGSSGYSNRHAYALIRKKITTTAPIIYKLNNLSVTLNSAGGYLPYSAISSDNSYRNDIKPNEWCDNYYFMGYKSFSDFKERTRYVTTGHGTAQTTSYYAAIEPKDDNTFYLLVCLPVERPNSLANAWRIDTISVSASYNTISYTSKNMLVGNNPISIDKNELINSDELANSLKNNILEDYSTGIEYGSVDMFYGGDNNIVSFEGCEDINGIPKTWKVVEVTSSYDGTIVKKLKLQQHICTKSLFTAVSDGGLGGGYKYYKEQHANNRSYYIIDLFDSLLPEYRDCTVTFAVGSSDFCTVSGFLKKEVQATVTWGDSNKYCYVSTILKKNGKRVIRVLFNSLISDSYNDLALKEILLYS